MAARSGELLSKPSHFTYATNHGVMQNLALWQICIAFPTVAREEYKQTAYLRMVEQMKFYVNDEGIVLEHSAGYHRAGLEFISLVFRYLKLMNMPIPDEWKEKYAKAKEFYAHLRRPDGSLPMFGDTRSNSDPSGPFVADSDGNESSVSLMYLSRWKPTYTEKLYPVAGYSIWWNGLEKWPEEDKLSQTVVLWSNFIGHAHKHADEMSVLLWAGGQIWWTNIGYWPYGVKGRSEAVSWNGSNAPHLVDERLDSERKTRMIAHGSSDNIKLLDMERSGPGTYTARRQVIMIKPNLWVILDYTSTGTATGRTRTIWTTSKDVTIHKGDSPGSFKLTANKKRNSLATFIFASEQAAISQYRGSLSPFAGWELNYPASALLVEQEASNSWLATVWVFEDDTAVTPRVTGQPYMKYFRGTDQWEIVVPLAGDSIRIVRQDASIAVHRDSVINVSEKLTLVKAPESSRQHISLQAEYDNAKSKYSEFKPGMSYRFRMAQLVIWIFVFQEFLFFISRWLSNARMLHTGLLIVCIFVWMSMIGGWFVVINTLS